MICSGSRIHSYSHIKDSVLLSRVVVGRSCRIQNAVIDKGTEIPPGTIIGEDREADEKRFYVEPESGIVLVTPDMFGQWLHRLR